MVGKKNLARPLCFSALGARYMYLLYLLRVLIGSLNYLCMCCDWQSDYFGFGFRTLKGKLLYHPISHFEVAHETRSVSFRIALWGGFGDAIQTWRLLRM